MHLMLQQPSPDDYVVALGETDGVQRILLTYVCRSRLNYRDYVEIDETVYRPAEVDLLIGDASKANSVLGWQPEVDFVGLVKEMVQSDVELLS